MSLAASARVSLVGFRVAFILEDSIEASTKQAHQRSNGDWVYPVFRNILKATAQAREEDLQQLADRLKEAFLDRLKSSGREVVDLGPLPLGEGGRQVTLRYGSSEAQVRAATAYPLSWEPEDILVGLPGSDAEREAVHRALAAAAGRTGGTPCAMVSVTLAFRLFKGTVRRMRQTFLESQPNNSLSFSPELALVADLSSVMVAAVDQGRAGERLRVGLAADRAIPGVFYKDPEKVAEWAGERRKAKGWFRTMFLGGMDKWQGGGEETIQRGVGLEVDPEPFSKACLGSAEVFFTELLPPLKVSSPSTGGDSRD